MSVLVAFASLASLSAPAQLQSLQAMQLHHLRALLTLGSLAMGPDHEGAPFGLSAPHEQAWALACGLDVTDGAVPVAAALAMQAGWEGQRPWGRITPSHWRLGTEQVSLFDPERLQLDESASRALFEAACGLFEDAGIGLHWLAPGTWLMQHPMLEQLPCASLDRVIGRNVDLWLGADPRVRPLRRLQSEVQMLWHQHPVNQAREARGLDAVNSFWIDGCGRWPQGWPAPTVQVEQGLRVSALALDERAWRDAFEALDATRLRGLLERARAGEPFDLWLSGERRWCRLRGAGGPAPRQVTGSWWARLRHAWGQPAKPESDALVALLQAL